jgi:aspartate 1-decarboxylase
MLIPYLHSKIHMAVITEARPDYVGSLTIDRDLMDAAGLAPFQKILIANCANGKRLETYVIEGARGAGDICLNGAAAHLGSPGDKIIIMAFCALTPEEAARHQPTIVLVREGNRPVHHDATAAVAAVAASTGSNR